MKNWWIICSLCAVAGMVACTPEEELISHQPGISLSFSRDTVLFDTLFTSRQSITRSLKVYNPGERAVESSILLAGGAASPYDIFVNGQAGTAFEDVLIRGGDSLLILVEAIIDPQDEDMPFLVLDSLLFLTNEKQQSVKLISWGQDAYFIDSWHISQDTSLSADRPYVILDSIWVQEQASLLIPEGAKLYFENNTSLWVDGSLHIRGSEAAPVIFTHTRQDGIYANAPGQWQGILLSEKSHDHEIDYALIRNAEVGIFMTQYDEDTIPDLRISNTIIENMSINGILAANADIDAYNLLISHCAVNAVGNFGRGYYRYIHCTFAHDVPVFSREGPVLFFADTLLAAPQLNQTFRLILENNIVWGNRANELAVVTELPGSAVEIRSNLIKAERAEERDEMDNIYNADPRFSDPAIYVYTLDSTSVAIDEGIPTLVEKDLLAVPRDEAPDLGAYEFIRKEEEQ
jgi:hypothetical protein